MKVPKRLNGFVLEEYTNQYQFKKGKLLFALGRPALIWVCVFHGYTISTGFKSLSDCIENAKQTAMKLQSEFNEAIDSLNEMGK